MEWRSVCVLRGPLAGLVLTLAYPVYSDGSKCLKRPISSQTLYIGDLHMSTPGIPVGVWTDLLAYVVGLVTMSPM